jgi:hypothetical protein
MVWNFGFTAIYRCIISRMIFDADKLSELFATLDLGWKERTKRELAN